MLIITKTDQEFVPESEREQAKPARFKFRLANFGDQFGTFALREGEDGKAQLDMSTFGKQMRHILCRCLTGWENIVDEAGKDIKFDKARPEKNVDLIPNAVAMELYNHIMAESNKGKTEEEQKN